MSVAAVPPPLDDGHRATLGALADQLVPGGVGLPSASKADVHGKWIDRVLRARPDLACHVLAVVTRGGEPRASLDSWRREDPETLESFTLAVTASYFMNPRVRRLLGYPGTAPKRKPAYPDEADFYLDGGTLLEPVIERGAIYRPTPREPLK